MNPFTDERVEATLDTLLEPSDLRTESQCRYAERLSHLVDEGCTILAPSPGFFQKGGDRPGGSSNLIRQCVRFLSGKLLDRSKVVWACRCAIRQKTLDPPPSLHTSL